MKDKTRELWLNEAIHELRKGLFKRHGYSIPKLRISFGLPHGRGSKRAIGQCWSSKSSVDKMISIFISPRIDDTDLVLSTLAHELIHAHLDNKHGHHGPFKQIALAIGLKGPMRATSAGPELKEKLESIKDKLGDIPHSKLLLDQSPIKKQTTRLIKMECKACGYIVRSAFKHIVEKGPVYCPCNRRPMAFEIKEV